MKGNGRGSWYQLVLTLAILSIRVDGEKQKRQIFREQVLPALGGKIPEEAFRTDRLALNRLNKEGISIPDGVILDARHVHKHPHQGIQGMPELIKVYLTPDGRYVPPEGRFHYNHPKAVDTTYIIRKPFIRGGHHKSLSNFGTYKTRGYVKPPGTYYRRILPAAPPAKSGPYKPVITPLVLPSPGRELLDNSYLPAWNLAWDAVYEPFDDYFANNIALFNSHQIITDYQGFLSDFHGRSLRHAGSRNGDRNQHEALVDNRKFGPRPSQAESQQSYQKNIPNIVPHNAGYTNLTKIPETSFSCRGRKGMYADVETKCQLLLNEYDETLGVDEPAHAPRASRNDLDWRAVHYLPGASFNERFDYQFYIPPFRCNYAYAQHLHRKGGIKCKGNLTDMLESLLPPFSMTAQAGREPLPCAHRGLHLAR